MTRSKVDPRRLVHTPPEMVTEYVQWAENIQATPGVKFGIPAIDEVLLPLRPGNVEFIIARPGMGKTSLLVYVARQHASRILAQGTQDKECVVYTTWEQTSEELTGMLMAAPGISYTDVAWGRADIEKIKSRASKAQLPVWIIGHGISRSGLSVPRMTPELVLAAIESMEEDFGVKPALMLFDYLQLIPTRQAKERVQQVSEMPILLKELAMRVGAPAIAAVQAKREVDLRSPPIPEQSDGQWSSAIEQTGDRVLSTWIPAKTVDIGDFVRVSADQEFEVTKNLLILRLLKQRGDVGRHTWGMYFDPALMRLAELETRQINNGQGREYPVDF